MAVISGKKGKAEYDGGFILGINNWNLDAETNMIDVSKFSTSTGAVWRDFIDGISAWSGTAAGFFDAASTGQTDLRTNMLTPASAQFIGYLDKEGGENLRGTVYISRMGHSVDVDGTASATYDLQGTGALTYSTAT